MVKFSCDREYRNNLKVAMGPRLEDGLPSLRISVNFLVMQKPLAKVYAFWRLWPRKEKTKCDVLGLFGCLGTIPIYFLHRNKTCKVLHIILCRYQCNGPDLLLI